MTREYEQGFAAGERASYFDRETGKTRQPPQQIVSDHTRGFWDGYTARDPEWAARPASSRCRMLFTTDA